MVEFQKTIPILRIFDVEKAKETTFYDAKCVKVIDPFGNRIRFNEDLKTGRTRGTSS